LSQSTFYFHFSKKLRFLLK